MTIGDTSEEIGPGDFIGYRAGGLAHTMQATGSEPLVCIVVGQRLAFDMGDYPRRRKRIYRQAGQPWNLVDHDNIEQPEAGGK